MVGCGWMCACTYSCPIFSTARSCLLLFIAVTRLCLAGRQGPQPGGCFKTMLLLKCQEQWLVQPQWGSFSLPRLKASNTFSLWNIRPALQKRKLLKHNGGLGIFTQTGTFADMQIYDPRKFVSIWQQIFLMLSYADRQANYIFYHATLHSTFAFLTVCLSSFMGYLPQFIASVTEPSFIFLLKIGY